LQRNTSQLEPISFQGADSTATETIPPYTPLATLTPSPTLRPPPTFEPPTPTREPSLTPTITPTPTLDLNVSIPGLRGAETPTPSTTPGCVPRKDWHLTYTVQRNDALDRIASTYNTSSAELAAGNCLTDPNVIQIGLELRVPGDVQPAVPEVQCIPFELLTPIDNTLKIPGDGQITFNWRGPLSHRNLIRIWQPDGTKYEIVLELAQNYTLDLSEITQSGTYTWYVYPLNYNFVQECPEGGPWHFTKAGPGTDTP
jgi:LysM repeat protein